MAISPFCSDSECTVSDTRLWLRATATYEQDGLPQTLHYELRRCPRCNLAFVHPTPTSDVMACFYQPDYTYYQQAADATVETEASSWKYKVARLRYAFLLAPNAWTMLETLAGRAAELVTRRTISFTLGVPLLLSKDTPILDYGFGSGAWLRTLARLGYHRLFGYDIGANPGRRREVERQGVRILTADDIADLSQGSMGCIRLEHVFEHLSDPPATLRMLFDLLAQGGFLVMTFPSVYPWMEIEDLAASPWLPHVQLPIHLAHHSVESAARLVRDAGFEIAGLRVTRRDKLITLLARKPGDARLEELLEEAAAEKP